MARVLDRVLNQKLTEGASIAFHEVAIQYLACSEHIYTIFLSVMDNLKSVGTSPRMNSLGQTGNLVEFMSEIRSITFSQNSLILGQVHRQ